jgi:methylglutaconyl-CoA hydratase
MRCAGVDAIDTCPAPVIAVVQGHAIGGGAGLVAIADIASPTSEPSSGSPSQARSPPPDLALRSARSARARPGATVPASADATTALRIGLVQGRADLDAALATFSAAPHRRPASGQAAKRLVLDGPDGPETARRIAERRASDEGQAGLSAFIERRRPPWAPPLEPGA